ncbi:MAG: carboxypeptidase-like regulatory domain-containing protein, partial [Terracidiphilus sp.]
MFKRLHLSLTTFLLSASLPAFATVFATVHGVVHDPQHRPIAGASVTLKAADSEFALHATTDTEGVFELAQTPIGVYSLTVTAPGFATVTQSLIVSSGTNPILHIPLSVGAAAESVVVEAAPSAADTVTPATLITRQMIEQTPGANRTTGMEMITDYVPGAYMT